MTNNTYVRGQGYVNSEVNYSENNEMSSNNNQTLVRGNAPSEPDAFDKFVKWLVDDWMMKLGALFVLAAIGWFAKYAYDNGWVSEQMSITIGLIVGLLIMFGGYFWSSKHRAQGGILLALGSASVISVIYAGHQVYGYFNPTMSLLMMFGVITFTVLSALKFDERALATLAVLMSAIAPWLSGTVSTSFYSTFAYLFVLSAGSLWIVYISRWRELVFENMLLVMFYSLPYWINYGSEYKTGLNELLFIFAFAAMFFVASIVGILRSKDEQDHVMSMFTAIGTGLLIFIWTLVSSPDQFQTFILLAWALIFGLGSYSVYVGSGKMVPFTIYGSVGTMMLVFATINEFDGAMLASAFAIEAFAITVMSALLTKKRLVATIASLTYILPILMSLPYIFSTKWSYSATFDGAIALYVLTIAMIVNAVIIIKMLPLPADAKVEDITMPKVLLLISGIYVAILVWLIPQALFTYNMAVATSLVIYTLIGITIYVMAFGKYELFMHRLGQLILLLVVARVLLVDFMNLNTAGRIIVFAILGSALIGTAFVKKNSSNKIEG